MSIYRDRRVEDLHKLHRLRGDTSEEASKNRRFLILDELQARVAEDLCYGVSEIDPKEWQYDE